MKQLFKYFKPDWVLALVGISMVVFAALLDLYQVQLMADIIDKGIATSNFDVIVNIGIQMIVLALIGTVISIFALIIPSQVSNNAMVRLREALFSKIQKFSMKSMNHFQTSSLVTRLTNDVNFLQRTLMMCLRMLVRAPILLISTIAFTYFVAPSLSWVMILAIIVLSAVLTYIVILGFPRFVKLQEKVDKLNRRIQESLNNIRVIKSFVREEYEDELFDEENKVLYDTSVKANILMTLMGPSMMAAVNITTLVVVWVSARLIVENHLFEVGELLGFITYLRFLMFSMLMITTVLMMLSRSKASVIRINEVLDTPIDIENPVDPINPSSNNSTIVFKDVSFRYYEKAENVLSNINLEIKPGEHLGIIGSTGSGKTTLVNLLGRLLEPSEGVITYGGVDIQKMDLNVLRGEFGFVPQKNILFSGTIESNLRLGNPTASKNLMRVASESASIYDFIKNQPDRFEYKVQQGGTNFSGGQRQRLCIARALCVEPNVLVLDDSTSALDAATESKVKEAIYSEYEHMTLISIAQKISSISDCDHIVVLDQGEMVGYGTHDELLETNAIYKEIYDSQIRKEVMA